MSYSGGLRSPWVQTGRGICIAGDKPLRPASSRGQAGQRERTCTVARRLCGNSVGRITGGLRGLPECDRSLEKCSGMAGSTGSRQEPVYPVGGKRLPTVLVATDSRRIYGPKTEVASKRSDQRNTAVANPCQPAIDRRREIINSPRQSKRQASPCLGRASSLVRDAASRCARTVRAGWISTTTAGLRAGHRVRLSGKDIHDARAT